MKLPKLLVYVLVLIFCLLIFLLLLKYKQKNDVNVVSRKEVKMEEKVLDVKLKEKIDEALVKYKNPKQATVRKINWEKVGKAYLVFDEVLNKTIFWLKLDDVSILNKNDKYYVWISERERPNPLMLNVGELATDSKEGMLYYEFKEEGKSYNYLNVIVSTSDNKEKITEENMVLKASFSDQLN